MKHCLLGLTTFALVGAAVPTVSARDHGWATAGKVLTGIAAVSLVARAFEAPPVYAAPPVTYPPACAQPAPVVVYSQPGYYAQPVYVQPEPVVVYQTPVYLRPAPYYRSRPVASTSATCTEAMASSASASAKRLLQVHLTSAFSCEGAGRRAQARQQPYAATSSAARAC